jgi:hypothetical protein
MTQTCKCYSDCEGYEITGEELKTILNKLTNGTVAEEDNIHSELYKYRLEKFKTELFKLFK